MYYYFHIIDEEEKEETREARTWQRQLSFPHVPPTVSSALTHTRVLLGTHKPRAFMLRATVSSNGNGASLLVSGLKSCVSSEELLTISGPLISSPREIIITVL